MWKRLCSVTLVFLLCLTPANALQDEDIGSRTAVVMDAQSEQILYEKAGDIAQPAGVAAQMMTVLLVLEAHDDLTQLVTITPEMLEVPTDAPVLGLQVGEAVTVRNLLSAVMLDGAADASQALALFMADSLPAFVEQMNARATDWQGETLFTSAHGYDAEGTITATAVAQMGGALSKLEKYCIMAKEAVATLTATDLRVQTVIYTENVQIRPDSSRYDAEVSAVMGGKTDAAGWVQTTYAQADGLVTVTMGAPNGTTAVQDSQMLFDTARNDFTARTFTAQQLQEMATQAGISTPQNGFTDLNLHIPNGLDGQTLSLALEGTTLQLVAGDIVTPVLGADIVLSAPASPRDPAQTEQPDTATPQAPTESTDTQTESTEGSPFVWSMSNILIAFGVLLLVSAGVVFAVVHMRRPVREEYDEYDEYDEYEAYDEYDENDISDVPVEAPAPYDDVPTGTPTLLFVDQTQSPAPAVVAPPEVPIQQPAPEPPAQPIAPTPAPVVKRTARTLSPNRGRQNRDSKRDALRQAYIEAFGIAPEEALAQAEALAAAEAAAAEAEAQAQAEAEVQAEAQVEATQPDEPALAVEENAVPEQENLAQTTLPFPEIIEQREMSTQELLALVESMKTLSGIPAPAAAQVAEEQPAPVASAATPVAEPMAPAVQEQAVADIQTAQESVESTLKELEILMQETMHVVQTVEQDAQASAREPQAEPDQAPEIAETVEQTAETAEPDQVAVETDTETAQQEDEAVADTLDAPAPVDEPEDFEKTLELPTLTDDMIAQIDALKRMQ